VPRAADLEDEADACHTRRWDRWAARRALLGVGRRGRRVIDVKFYSLK
jgi:hypothetical protein